MQSTKSVRPLCSLAYGETAVIASVYLHGAIRRRLQDLGWIPGTAIRCLQTAGRRRPHRLCRARRRGRPAPPGCQNDPGTIE